MILEAYLVTTAISLTSLTINNTILKKRMKRDGFIFKKSSLGEKLTNAAPIIVFGLAPIYNLIVTGAILTGGDEINKYMVNRLLENTEKTTFKEDNEQVIKEEEEKIEENYKITTPEDIKTPQDRIAYVSYEYEKEKKENKPYTLVRKR